MQKEFGGSLRRASAERHLPFSRMADWDCDKRNSLVVWLAVRSNGNYGGNRLADGTPTVQNSVRLITFQRRLANAIRLLMGVSDILLPPPREGMQIGLSTQTVNLFLNGIVGSSPTLPTKHKGVEFDRFKYKGK